MKYFNISVDHEDMHRYLVTLGNKSPNNIDENSAFEKGIPRFLELFAEYGISATFFITGEEVIKKPINKKLIKDLYNAGHEIANHTYHHYFNFSNLPYEIKRREILDCQILLEDTIGDKIVGFRAPCYDIDEDTVNILEENGYLYDSSIYPFYFKILQQMGYYVWNLLHKKGIGKWRKVGAFKHSFAPVNPYFPSKHELIKQGERKIVEIPIPMVGVLRFPFYSTFIFNFGLNYFHTQFNKLIKDYNFFTFELHSIDLVDYKEDLIINIYEDLLSHPCMKLTLAEKVSILSQIFAQFQKEFRNITLKNFAVRFINGTDRD